MKSLRNAILLVLALTSILFTDNWMAFGKPITTADQTTISTILAHPEEYVGKKILVQDCVVDACKKNEAAGWNWSAIKNFKPFVLKYKMGIIFPLEGCGHLTLVEGIVEKLAISI